MGTASQMIRAAEKSLGMSGRPNTITREYASRHGNGFLRAAWCDMAVTKWARDSGNADAVLPSGDRAYTVWHAQDFQKIRRWRPGTWNETNAAQPGDIVFFDWGGTDSIGYIDHVGVVVKSLGNGRVETIEGNTGDACKRRVRSYADIAGFGRPAYSGGSSSWTEKMVQDLPMIKRGDQGEHVQSVQGLLIARSHPEVSVTGSFDATTEKAVKAVQKWGKVDDDGIVGPQTWPVLLRVH